MAQVPIATVAQIAATLMKDGKTTCQATKEAFELLEIATHCNLSLKTDGSYEAGITDFEKHIASWEGLKKGVAALPKWEHKKNKARIKAFQKFTERRDALTKELAQERNANKRQEIAARMEKNDRKLSKLDLRYNKRFQTVPFDEGLKELMRNFPTQSLKNAERETRFKAWFSDHCKGAKPKQGDQERMIEVGDALAKMKQQGIPAGLFEHAAVMFNEDWWKSRISNVRSAARDNRMNRRVIDAQKTQKKF